MTSEKKAYFPHIITLIRVHCIFRNPIILKFMLFICSTSKIDLREKEYDFLFCLGCCFPNIANFHRLEQTETVIFSNW